MTPGIFVGIGNTKRADVVTTAFSVFYNILFLVSMIFTLISSHQRQWNNVILKIEVQFENWIKENTR